MIRGDTELPISLPIEESEPRGITPPYTGWPFCFSSVISNKQPSEIEQIRQVKEKKIKINIKNMCSRRNKDRREILRTYTYILRESRQDIT